LQSLENSNAALSKENIALKNQVARHEQTIATLRRQLTKAMEMARGGKGNINVQPPANMCVDRMIEEGQSPPTLDSPRAPTPTPSTASGCGEDSSSSSASSFSSSAPTTPVEPGSGLLSGVSDSEVHGCVSPFELDGGVVTHRHSYAHREFKLTGNHDALVQTTTSADFNGVQLDEMGNININLNQHVEEHNGIMEDSLLPPSMMHTFDNKSKLMHSAYEHVFKESSTSERRNSQVHHHHLTTSDPSTTSMQITHRMTGMDNDGDDVAPLSFDPLASPTPSASLDMVHLHESMEMEMVESHGKPFYFPPATAYFSSSSEHSSSHSTVAIGTVASASCAAATSSFSAPLSSPVPSSLTLPTITRFSSSSSCSIPLLPSTPTSSSLSVAHSSSPSSHPSASPLSSSSYTSSSFPFSHRPAVTLFSLPWSLTEHTRGSKSKMKKKESEGKDEEVEKGNENSVGGGADEGSMKSVKDGSMLQMEVVMMVVYVYMMTMLVRGVSEGVVAAALRSAAMLHFKATASDREVTRCSSAENEMWQSRRCHARLDTSASLTHSPLHHFHLSAHDSTSPPALLVCT